ncbi:MAG TPA: mRNA surveillance protein Pelota, partial [Candidatus Nanoarchaeia archaeon]|nr:mRNA surveillance protein Pelota [Candidatus Nanoarchaeia archaeon]
GFDEVKRATDAGAVKQLLITDGYIKKTREEETFNTVEMILKSVDSAKGKIIIISSEHDGGKKLDGIGGIAVLLRYQFD